MKALNTRENRGKKTILLASEYLEQWHDYLVLVSLFGNWIFLFNMKTHIIEKMISIKFTEKQDNLFRYFTIYNDIVVLVPFEAKDFITINLRSGEQEIITHALSNEEKMVATKFLFGIKRDNYLWCIGQNINKVICYDLSAGMKRVKEIEYQKDIYWSDAYAMVDEYIYIPSMNQNLIMIINVNNFDVITKTYFHKDNMQGMLGIASMKNILYLCDREGRVYTTFHDNFCLSSNNNEKSNSLVVSRQCFIYNQKLYRVSLYEDSIYEENIDTGETKKIVIEIRNKFQGKRTHFQNGYVMDGVYWGQTRYGELFKVYLDNMEYEYIEPKVEGIADYEEESKHFWSKRLGQEVIYEELFEGIFGIEDYINEIKQLY